jgi:AAA family ATP:ADP antiporter
MSMLDTLRSVREDERPPTLYAFLTLFGVMAAHAVLETARDVLFLAELSAARLPWVYLAIAAAALLVTVVQRRTGSATGSRPLTLLLLGAAVVSTAFWLGLGGAGTWILYVLYVWSGLLVTLLVLQFWLVVQEPFTVAQARRLFALIGTGGVLGAIAGAGLARLITAFAGDPALLPAAAVLFALTAFLPSRLEEAAHGDADRRTPMTEPVPSIAAGCRAVVEQPYLRRLGLLVLVSTVALTLVDFLWKSFVDAGVPADRLGVTFSTTYLVLNVLSLLVQVFLVGRLTRSLGVAQVLAVLPALIVLGGVGILAGGGLVAAFVLKGADGGLRHSLHRTTTEVLFVPLSATIRATVKSVIDVGGQRGGQALASILILVVMGLGGGMMVLSGMLLALAVGWLLLAVWIRPHYVELFRATLRQGVLTSRSLSLDLESLEALLAALSSSSERDVLTALDLLHETGRIHLVQALILYHPSGEVVERAIDLFSRAGRTDHIPIARGLVGHLDSRVRAAVVRALNGEALELSERKAFLLDPSIRVRGSAVAGLIAAGAINHRETRNALEEVLGSSEVEGRRSLARAIEEHPEPAFDYLLMSLASDPDPEVKVAAARAMRSSRNPSFLPVLIGLLDRRNLRHEVRDSLRTFGDTSLRELERTLVDVQQPRAVRLHVPRTIALFDPQVAADLLLRRYPDEPDGAIRFKILKVLGFLRLYHPGVRFDPDVVDHAVGRTLEVATRLLDWRCRLEAGARLDPRRRTKVHELLVTLLLHKERHAVDRALRLLHLVHPGEDFRRIRKGLRSPSADARARGRELLEHALVGRVRMAMMSLLDDAPDAERLAGAAAFHSPADLDYEGVLVGLLDSGGAALESLVVYHVGELRLTGLRSRVEAISAASESGLRDIVRRTVAALGLREGEVSA